MWTDGVFRASWYPVESLEAQIDQSDFAIAIVQPDDITIKRGVEVATARDNVIFELGLFIGRFDHSAFGAPTVGYFGSSAKGVIIKTRLRHR